MSRQLEVLLQVPSVAHHAFRTFLPTCKKTPICLQVQHLLLWLWLALQSITTNGFMDLRNLVKKLHLFYLTFIDQPNFSDSKVTHWNVSPIFFFLLKLWTFFFLKKNSFLTHDASQNLPHNHISILETLVKNVSDIIQCWKAFKYKTFFNV